jgi:2'-5' RNA ligase
MPFAVELYFDPASEATIRRIWQAIAQAGLKSPMLEAGYRPHVSLAVYDGDTLDVANLIQDLRSYAPTIAPFSLALSTIGLFPTAEGVVFLGVTVTKDLLELHTGFHRAFARYAGQLRSYYAVGNWVPHCTLSAGVSVDDSAAILPICWSTPLPIQGQVEEIGLAKVSPVHCDLLFVISLI